MQLNSSYERRLLFIKNRKILSNIFSDGVFIMTRNFVRSTLTLFTVMLEINSALKMEKIFFCEMPLYIRETQGFIDHKPTV